MKLSTTKFALFLVLVVCLIATKVIAHHHDWEDDCDHDDDDNEDWDEDNDWDDDDNDWDDDKGWYNDNNDWDNKDWDDKSNNDWNNGQNWGKNNNDWNNGQGWNSGSQPSGSIVVSSTIWSGSGWPMPTNNGQPQSSMYYPSGTPGVVTATWTQVMTTTGRPTNIKSEPQIGNMASVKSIGIPVMLAAILFYMLIVA